MTAPVEIPERPCLKPWYRLAQTNGRLILEYGQDKVVFEGKAVSALFPVLLPLVDGTRSVEQISRSLGEAAGPAVGKALETLAAQGLLTDGPAAADMPAPAAQTAQFLAATGPQGRSVAEAGKALDAAVAVIGTGALAAESARQLRKSGIADLTLLEWAAGDAELDGLDLAIVAPDPGELPELADWNRTALRARQPWLQVLPFDGRVGIVGPLYVPDETCCYECYRRRRRANLRWSEADDQALEQNPASYPAPPALRDMLAAAAALAAMDWLYQGEAGAAATVWAGSASVLRWGAGIEVSRHQVYRVPRCPECFADDLGTASPWHG